MFHGDSNHSMDKKGRVFMPKRFQEQLSRDKDGNLSGVLTFGFEGSLGIYSQEGFADLADSQNTETFTTPEARRAQRRFFKNTLAFTLDGSGRFVVPERFRKFAGLEAPTEVVMLGVSKRGEIWNVDRYAAYYGDDDDFDDLGQGFGPVSGADEPGGAA